MRYILLTVKYGLVGVGCLCFIAAMLDAGIFPHPFGLVWAYAIGYFGLGIAYKAIQWVITPKKSQSDNKLLKTNLKLPKEPGQIPEKLSDEQVEEYWKDIEKAMIDGSF